MIRNKKDDGKDCSKEEMKILESKRIILEEKEKIKKEKKKIHTKKMDKFKKTKFGQFLGKFIYIFSDEKNSYSFSEVFVITIVSLVLGAFACFSVFMIIQKQGVKTNESQSHIIDLEVKGIHRDDGFTEENKDHNAPEASRKLCRSVGADMPVSLITHGKQKNDIKE